MQKKKEKLLPLPKSNYRGLKTDEKEILILTAWIEVYLNKWN